MERRFKIGYVSVNEVSKYGEDFGVALQKSLPEGTVMLGETTDFDSASLKLFLYNPEWKIAPLGRNLGKIIIEIKELEERKHKLAYGH